MRRSVDAVVLLYHRPLLGKDAETVREHIGSFPLHSRFPIVSLNTARGFPPGLAELEPTCVVLHYSLFGAVPYRIGEAFLEWLDRLRECFRVAFFQDEYRQCGVRFRFLDDHRVDCVFTLVEPPAFEQVYGQHTRVSRLVYTLPGYVAPGLISAGQRFARPDTERTIDIGYRARRLPPYMGRGAQEKAEIGLEFVRRATGSGLRLDIDVDEGGRLYGDAWYRFLANCRGCLGVEAGVSVFDLEDEAMPACTRYLAERPAATFAEVERDVLAPFEDRIFYRTISPRHFEAAAFRVCPILFEGRYSGILEPGRHYLPLTKDFSNLAEVIDRFRDPSVRRAITDAAYEDLIESGRYEYARFIERFDAELLDAGLRIPEMAPAPDVVKQMTSVGLARTAKVWGRVVSNHPFAGKQRLLRLARPLARSLSRR